MSERLRQAYLMGRRYGFGVSEIEWLELPDMSADEREAFNAGFAETDGEGKGLAPICFAVLLLVLIIGLFSLAWWVK
jgi:hypothetical protein